MAIKRQTVFPVKIICEKNVSDSKNLLQKKDLQILTEESNLSGFKKGSSVILDFGLEYRGVLRILCYFSDNAKCRIRLGESVEETNSDVGVKGATNDHSTRDCVFNLTSHSDMPYLQGGFRFVRLDVLSGKATIKNIVIESEILSQKPVYEYKGKDELVKNIFYTAKRTVDLCSAGKFVWDGIKRDRLVWVGDLHPEMLALTTLYGESKCVENSLNLIRRQTQKNTWVNGIATYSMWWIIITADYFKITKKENFAVKQLDFIKSIVSQMENCINEKGETFYPWDFIDWPSSESKDLNAGVRALNIIALNKAKELFKYFKKDTKKIEELLCKLKKNKIVAKESKQVVALKYFAVGIDEEDKKILVKGGAKGISTFMAYYILTAIASFDKQKAVRIMKEYYGAMLNLGATTFWEDFNIDWAKNAFRIDQTAVSGKKDIHGDFGAYCYEGFRHSLCHGWSSGIIKFIKENC